MLEHCHMHHPFSSLPQAELSRSARFSLKVAIGCIAIAILLNATLISSQAPLGMVSLSLCGNTLEAESIINHWPQREKVLGAFSLGFDTLVLLAYGGWLSLVALQAGHRMLAGKWSSRKNNIAWLAWLAAGCDLMENILTIAMMCGNTSSPVPQTTAFFLLAKVLFLAIVILYCFAGFWLHSANTNSKP